MSAMIDETTKEEIRKRLVEINDYFSKAMWRAYVGAVVANAKGEEASEYQLHTPPPASEPIAKGVVKLRKSYYVTSVAWSKTLTINNEADNFRIDISKKKVHCCGYTPSAVDDSAEAFQLEPADPTQRTFTLLAADGKAREGWLDALKVACRRAEPARDEDDNVHEAFQKAYRSTRRFCGGKGLYYVCMPESQMLGALEYRVVRDEFLENSGGLYSNIPEQLPDFARDKVKKGLDKIVGPTVVSLSDAGWTAARQSVEGGRSTVESTVKTTLGPLQETQDKIRAAISGPVSDKAKPVLDRLGKDLVQPLTEHMLPAVISAYKQALDGFGKLMRPLLAAKEPALDERCKKARHLVDDFSGRSGPMAEPTQTLKEVRKNTVLAGAVKLHSPCTLDKLVDQVEDPLRKLLHNAIYTFYTNCEQAEPVEAIKTVAPMLAHDLYLTLKDQLAAVVVAVLEDQLAATLGDNMQALVEPVADQVPEEVTPIFDIEQFVDDLQGDIMQDAADKTTEAALESLSTELNEQATAAFDPIEPRDGDYTLFSA